MCVCSPETQSASQNILCIFGVCMCKNHHLFSSPFGEQTTINPLPNNPILTLRHSLCCCCCWWCSFLSLSVDRSRSVCMSLYNKLNSSIFKYLNAIPVLAFVYAITLFNSISFSVHFCSFLLNSLFAPLYLSLWIWLSFRLFTLLFLFRRHYFQYAFVHIGWMLFCHTHNTQVSVCPDIGNGCLEGRKSKWTENRKERKHTNDEEK